MRRSPESPPRVAVLGSSEPGGRCRELAHEVGRRLGAAGAVVLCGGRGGVMEEACRGALEEGGLTVGVLPGADASESPPNPYVRLPLFTGLGQARNVVLVLSAEAAIAVGGGWGTLSEIALARKHGRPVVLLESWELAPPGRGGEGDSPLRAASAAEAVELALAAIGGTTG